MPAHVDKTITLTDPVINGGSYRHEVTGEEGFIMGVEVDKRNGKRIGLMYTRRRGALPSDVTENSESMTQWKLERAGSDKTASGLVGAHRKKYADKE